MVRGFGFDTRRIRIYIGCVHACEYCYSIMDKYCHFDEPDDFCRIIQVKKNAALLLRKELELASPVGTLGIGDYQPAEKEFQLSRKMLTVVCDLGWPVFLLEESNLVVRDLDLLQAINSQSQAVVAFSIIGTDDRLLKKIEPRATPPSQRFRAMRIVADAGIQTGTCLMPVLPGITDEDETIRAVVKATADVGGSFVLCGGLILNDKCGVRFRKFIGREFPELSIRSQDYDLNSAPDKHYWRKISKRVTKYCDDCGIGDSIKRYIPEGKFRHNKFVSEILFHITKLLEDLSENRQQVWRFRKAAWAIDELEVNVKSINEIGSLIQIEDVDEITATVIKEILESGQSTLHLDLQKRWRM